MKDLEPITREETMLAKVAGQDVPTLEPVTREEYFLAKAGGQDVPELEPVTRKEYFLADVIEAIESGGGGSDLGTKTISENGVYKASDDSLDGYSKVTVDVPASAVDSGTKIISSNGSHDVTGYASASVSVPNSYEAGDEGKVVSNGALVSQTSDTVTENDTYDTTLINSLTVNVSGGGGYSMDDIIDRTPITGAVTYSGDTTTLKYGCLAYSNITAFTSDTVTSSQSYTFYSCKNLVTVDMPNFAPSATNTAAYMFAECDKLRTVNIPKFKRADVNVFQNCKALEMLVLPSADYKLGNYFANGCTALHTVDVGGGYSGDFAGGNAFSYTGLTTLIMRRTGSALTVGNNVFGNSPLAANGSGGDIYVPQALLSTYQSASNWSSLNATWHSIEGSNYETHYADGTVIA